MDSIPGFGFFTADNNKTRTAKLLKRDREMRIKNNSSRELRIRYQVSQRQ
jgi:hypothetical protein